MFWIKMWEGTYFVGYYIWIIYGFDLYPDLAHLRQVGRSHLGGCLLFCSLCHETFASAALHFDRKLTEIAERLRYLTTEFRNFLVHCFDWIISVPLCWYFLSNPTPFMALSQLCLPGRCVTTYPKAGRPLARISMRAKKQSTARTASRSAADFREESRAVVLFSFPVCFLWPSCRSDIWCNSFVWQQWHAIQSSRRSSIRTSRYPAFQQIIYAKRIIYVFVFLVSYFVNILHPISSSIFQQNSPSRLHLSAVFGRKKSQHQAATTQPVQPQTAPAPAVKAPQPLPCTTYPCTPPPPRWGNTKDHGKEVCFPLIS